MGEVALEEGQSEGAPEGDYGQKDRFPPKMTVKTGECWKKCRAAQKKEGLPEGEYKTTPFTQKVFS